MAARPPFLAHLSLLMMAVIALALASAPLAAADRAAHAEMTAMASGDCASHEKETSGTQKLAAENCIAACLAGQIAVAASLAIFAHNVPHAEIMARTATQQPPSGLTPGLDPPPPRSS